MSLFTLAGGWVFTWTDQMCFYQLMNHSTSKDVPVCLCCFGWVRVEKWAVSGLFMKVVYVWRYMYLTVLGATTCVNNRVLSQGKSSREGDIC